MKEHGMGFDKDFHTLKFGNEEVCSTAPAKSRIVELKLNGNTEMFVILSQIKFSF